MSPARQETVAIACQRKAPGTGRRGGPTPGMAPVAYREVFTAPPHRPVAATALSYAGLCNSSACNGLAFEAFPGLLYNQAPSDDNDSSRFITTTTPEATAGEARLDSHEPRSRRPQALPLREARRPQGRRDAPRGAGPRAADHR